MAGAFQAWPTSSKSFFAGGGAAYQQLLPPFGSFLRLAPILIQLDQPFTRAVKVVPFRDVYPVLPRQHPRIPFQQQRFRLGIFLLSSQAGAKQALDAESLPVVR